MSLNEIGPLTSLFKPGRFLIGHDPEYRSR